MNYLKIEDFPTDSQIKVLILNRPEVKNAFHPEMISELTVAFQRFQNDSNIKAVVLKGEGSSFCAGADLNWMKEMVKYTFEQNKKDSENLFAMFEAILQCPVPVIGVIHGSVYGGGLGLVACCDYVLAEEQSQFCFSEVRLGLAPAVISSFVRVKVADGLVRPFMLSAEVFQVDTALRMGLVHATGRISKYWKSEIEKFSANGLEAMKETKKLLAQIYSSPAWIEQKKRAIQVISELRVSTEAQSRIRKFIEKK